MQDRDTTPASEVRIGLFLPGTPEPAPSSRELIIDGAVIPFSALRAQVAKPFSAKSAPAPRPADLPGQMLFLPDEPEEKKVVLHTGEEVSTMTWQKYLALRPTTCKPRLTSGKAVTDALTDEGIEGTSEIEIADMVRSDMLEEINQATLEFVGEAAELAELCYQNGFKTLYGDNRKKLIDECGDILFTASWALDAWCLNPLPGVGLDNTMLADVWEMAAQYTNPFLEMDDTELVRVTDDDPPAMIAQTILQSGGMALAKNRGFVGTANSMIFHHASSVSMLAGLTANAYKKLRYQRREQSIPTQMERICTALISVNILLIMANSSIEEAMTVNRAKLDKRYPDGPAEGGGIRTEG
jgi:hypothetical protein